MIFCIFWTECSPRRNPRQLPGEDENQSKHVDQGPEGCSGSISKDTRAKVSFRAKTDSFSVHLMFTKHSTVENMDLPASSIIAHLSAREQFTYFSLAGVMNSATRGDLVNKSLHLFVGISKTQCFGQSVQLDQFRCL